MRSAKADIPAMTVISFHISDELKHGVEARIREGAYPDIEAYLSDLIRADLEQGERWEMTPELAAALEAGEASGYKPYDFPSIVAEARAKFREK
jgi:Arc/MetJ-type ribon-helix-helix transcriptional regulator